MTVNEIGTQWTRTMARHDIIATIGVDGVNLAVWLAATRLDGWHMSYPQAETAYAEARRVRALLERYGSIAAVERRREQTLAELHAASTESARRALNVRMDELENLADRAAVLRLTQDVTDFLTTTA
jgi:hypothetical protein